MSRENSEFSFRENIPGKYPLYKKKVATFKPKFDLEAHQRALMVVASE